MGNVTVPAPLVFSPSQSWDGNDGSWSTFTIRVGTPEQNFRVLPSTSGQEIWVPVPEGCISTDPSDCGDLRGVYPYDGKASSGFLANQSSTWKSIGLYDLILEHQLGYAGAGMYGFDTVGLMIQNSGGPSLSGQVVAGIATKDFYLGIFGLGPKPSNFSNFDYPQPSYMRSLKDQNKIPSLSYGYTAGASYRIPQLPGSLTFGGYDTSRFDANPISFPFGTDDSKVLSIGIQGITATNTLQGTVSLMSTEILSLVDSTVPQIWLPRTVCDDFENAFGLQYDNKTDLYLVNDTIHTQLQKLNPQISFVLGNTGNPADTVSISLPYGAFDLQAKSPIYANTTNYFPLRRAANDTQYTLGRAFLQEAYVIADYGHSNFSVHQAHFESHMPPQTIVAILPPGGLTHNTTNGTSTPQNSKSLPVGAVAGISVGAAAILLLVAAALVYFFRRRGRQNKEAPLAELSLDGGIPPWQQNRWHYGAELMSEQKHELDGPNLRHELGGEKGPALLSDDAVVKVHEMPASDFESPFRLVVTSGTQRSKDGP
ncbi:acid protease [Mytilinidion resinicola]|uniref:Acid protease n=1 Tax=Mytilinidion resinicola TaxID=574789 RepID=A0A6A6YZY1_9PEZI|nr:acid protease [Mytilinidion resinicola]KAF2814039.1 acid protease [Mytilinidion resinicola]